MSLTPMVNVDPAELLKYQSGDIVLPVNTPSSSTPAFTITILPEYDQENIINHHHHQQPSASSVSKTPLVDQSNNVVVIDNDEVSTLSKKNFFRDEKLLLECEWDDCGDYCDNISDFTRHVTNHISEAEVRTLEPPLEDVFGCLWSECGFETPESSEMVRHINFHAFHTKIKCHGLNMLSKHGLAPCSLDPGQRNIVPDLSESWRCQWRGCETGDTCHQQPRDFYLHVSSHAEELRGEVVRCRWGECSSQAGTVSKLKEHLRSHTQEKMIGCPNCGALFSNRVKFLDHCKRQQAANSEDCFKCSNCGKKFATERLLRDHMRSHINHYKCPHCDMTKPTPSTLARHVRYKHDEEKPFKCSYCEYAGKNQQDLNGHMKVHYEDMEYKCTEANCNYKCRASMTLKKHIMKRHQNLSANNYACHLCVKRFNRGNNLTKHLMKSHNFTWPSGHSRFRYIRDEVTGVYRLQTIRFESVDLQEQLELGGDSLRIADNSDLESVASGHLTPEQPGQYPLHTRTSSPVHSVGGWSSYRSQDADVEESAQILAMMSSSRDEFIS